MADGQEERALEEYLRQKEQRREGEDWRERQSRDPWEPERRES